MPLLRFLCWTAFLCYIAYLTIGIIWSVRMIEAIPVPVYDPSQMWNQGPSKRHMERSQKERVYIQVKPIAHEKAYDREAMIGVLTRGIVE